MLFEDTYKTIDSISEGVYKEKGSKFIAEAIPVKDEDEVKIRLAELRKKYHDARHHCYAYRIGFEKDIFRTNDDGEPSGTAGKPIYGQLLSKDVTFVLVVVVRYFGGTKLGVSGLINAYRTATREALEIADIKTKVIQDVYEINYPYEVMNDVMKIMKDAQLKQLSQTFELNCRIEFCVRKKDSTNLYEQFSKINKLSIKYLRTI
jgi:uncharacterized YigZ family protein